jgi:hypothetical protein
VKPEAAEHLDRAGEYLTKAHNLLNVLHYNDEAGRAVYLAALHAAQGAHIRAHRPARQLAWWREQPV